MSMGRTGSSGIGLPSRINQALHALSSLQSALMAVWLHINKQNKRSRTDRKREIEGISASNYEKIRTGPETGLTKRFFQPGSAFTKRNLDFESPLAVMLCRCLSQSVNLSVNQSGSLSGSPSFTELYNNNNVLIEQKSSTTIAEPVEQQLLREPQLPPPSLCFSIFIFISSFCLCFCLSSSSSALTIALLSPSAVLRLL